MSQRSVFLFLGAILLLSIHPSFVRADESESETATLTIGSKAPALDIEHWVQDGGGKYKKVKEFETGKVYVVEFWATWCGPCIASMPHLAEVQNKYGDKGVQLISISDEDLDTVTGFLDREVPSQFLPNHGKDEGNDEEEVEEEIEDANDRQEEKPKGITFREVTSAYCLTTDPDRSCHAAYMEAAGQNGIPTAFIVGKDSQIEWIGHPMTMDEPLEKIVSGSWDREEFAKKLKAEQEVQFAMSRVVGLLRQGKVDKGLAALETIIESADGSGRMQMKLFRLQLLAQLGNEKVGSAIEELVAEIEDPHMLNQVAWVAYQTAASGKGIGAVGMKAAIEGAEKALKATPDDGAILDTLAHLLYQQGDLDKAIEVQTRALKNAGESREQIQTFLDQLNKEKDGGKN